MNILVIFIVKFVQIGLAVAGQPCTLIDDVGEMKLLVENRFSYAVESRRWFRSEVEAVKAAAGARIATVEGGRVVRVVPSTGAVAWFSPLLQRFSCCNVYKLFCKLCSLPDFCLTLEQPSSRPPPAGRPLRSQLSSSPAWTRTSSPPPPRPRPPRALPTITIT